MTQLNVLNSIVPSVDSQARQYAGSTFSCSLEYLLMHVHDLNLAPSEITNPDTFEQAYLSMLASEYEYDNFDRARELLGHDSDD